MQLITEMALPYLPVETPEFDGDPMRFIDEIRAAHSWLARMSEGYFVHGYRAVKDFCGMDSHLRPSFDDLVEYYGAKDTAWGRFMEENILALSGPKHTRIRNSAALAFSPRNVNRFRTQMQQYVAQLLDEWVPKGRFDFAECLADFPVSILCGMLGTSTEDIPKIRYYLDTQGQTFSLNRKLLPDFLASYDVMWAYLDSIIVNREKSGTQGEDSLLDSLISKKNTGAIDETELRYLLMVLFPAGYDTSRNLLAMTVYTLLEYPEIWNRCGEDADYCDKVVDEMLRYSPVATPFRTVAVEFDYDGVRFPVETRLFLGNTVAGQDPAVFPDGEEFKPDRIYPDRHVAFGRGSHICIGQHLARVQTIEALRLITRRIRNPRLAGKVTWRLYMGTRGPTSLPIEFEPVLGEQ